MNLDPQTLAVVYVILSSLMGLLLFFSWAHNRQITALAWWGTSFCLVPVAIGLVDTAKNSPSHISLVAANTLLALAYAALYAGCRNFNGRSSVRPAMVLGPVIWILSFPFLMQDIGARIALLSLICGSYVALAAWELWRHAPSRFASQRAAVLLLLVLVGFNIVRALHGSALRNILWSDVVLSRWTIEMALFLVIYMPVLAVVLLSMAKQRIEQDLRESEEHYRYSVELSPQIPWTAGPIGNQLSVSLRWQELTGQTPKQSRGSGWANAVHAEDHADIHRSWQRSVETGQPFTAEYRVRLIDGTYRWFRSHAAPRKGKKGEILRWYGTVEDVHDRKVAQEQLRLAAYHDELTGLPNRRFFYERFQEAIEQARAGERRIGLLVMDLDHLKLVNDRFGHDAGDALLREFAQRLQSIARAGNTAARLGGDEFGLLLPNVTGEEEVAAMARVILARMQNPLPSDNGSHDCRTSIGAVLSQGDGLRAEDLQKQADLALYQSKAAGRGMFMMFNSVMSEEAQRIASALTIAGNALSSNWVLPFYQPQISLTTGAPAGFEALLRWEHPRLGIQFPDAISPAFNDTELGSALGARMRALIFADLRRWRETGLSFGRVAINASAAEFRHNDYAERVLAELRAYGIPAACLEVEVTESVFLDRHAGHVERALSSLSEAGVTIALDDFGTGYASLTHLKRFPVHVIKIDRAFVSGLEQDTGDTAIVKALLSLGQSLGISVVAEGVETARQVAFLREHGCDLVQGYYYARPLPASDVVQLMET